MPIKSILKQIFIVSILSLPS